jgi:hypothetical protein
MRNLTAPLFLLPLVWAGGNAETTIVSNDKVTVSETSLAPGEEQSTHGGLPSLLVFPEAGALEIVNGVESLGTRVVPGNVSFEPAEARTVKNAGTSRCASCVSTSAGPDLKKRGAPRDSRPITKC